MMSDPIFQKQMKAMMGGDKSLSEATTRAKEKFAELSRDPAKMAAMAEKIEAVMKGGDLRPDLSEGMRKHARMAAGQQFGLDPAKESPKFDRSIDGATNAKLGYEALQESLKNPKAMADAMQMLKDPEMQAEMKRMMNDPGFRQQLAAMQQDPAFKEGLLKSAESVAKMMGDPEALAKVQRQMGNR